MSRFKMGLVKDLENNAIMYVKHLECLTWSVPGVWKSIWKNAIISTIPVTGNKVLK